MHALYPISGNPPTFGHADIAARASRLFSQVTWALGFNPNKTYEVPVETRLEMMRDYVAHLKLDNVNVAAYEGATVRFAEKTGAEVLVKGLRNPADLQAEMEQAFGNRGMNPQMETVVLLASPEHALVNSTLIRELIKLGENVDRYVLPSVAESMRKALGI